MTDQTTETARLQDEILTLRAELERMRDLLRSENQRANQAIEREETAEQAALEAEQERDQLLAGHTVQHPPVDRAALRRHVASAADGVFEAWRQGLGPIRPQDALTAAVLAELPAPADRAAALHEAASAACSGAVEFNTEAVQAALENGGPFALIAYAQLAIADHLRRMADEAQPAEAVHQPRRGDQFEAWLKAKRDEHRDTGRGVWSTLDNLLDRYQQHADTRTPLGEHVCEGQVAGDCECLEQPADEARQDGADRG